MIKIDISHTKIDGKNLKALLKKSKALNRKRLQTKRNEFISAAKNRTWSKLSDNLAKVSEYKCWYSEVYEIGGYFHVDHFRPKNGLKLYKGAKGQNLIVPATLAFGGYWWEAYNWENYRLSAPRSNSGSKSNYFPISSASTFWDNRTNPNNEIPLLLDPLIQADCDLLIFDASGKALANPITAASRLNKNRVDATINILGLNDQAFISARKMEWAFTDKIAALADEANTKITASAHLLPSDILALLRKTKTLLIDILKKRIDKSAQFSKLNICCIVSLGKVWLKKELGI